MATISGITGLTLPGMIDEPGCSAGNSISFNPVMGPLDIRRRSLETRISSRARLRRAEEATAMGNWLCMAGRRPPAMPGALRQEAQRQGGEAGMAVDPGPHRGAAQAQLEQPLGGVLDFAGGGFHGGGVGGELLAEPDGQRVLQVGAAGGEHV